MHTLLQPPTLKPANDHAAVDGVPSHPVGWSPIVHQAIPGIGGFLQRPGRLLALSSGLKRLSAIKNAQAVRCS